MLGPYIGKAHLKGKGLVRVFTTDKPNRLDCLTSRDEVVRVNRDRLTFIKDKPNASN